MALPEVSLDQIASATTEAAYGGRPMERDFVSRLAGLVLVREKDGREVYVTRTGVRVPRALVLLGGLGLLLLVVNK